MANKVKIPAKLVLPTKQSTAAEWIAWYDQCKSYFGRKDANSLFIGAWQQRAGSDADTSDLRRYMDEQGVKVDRNIAEAAYDSGAGFVDSIGNIFKTGATVMIVMAVITFIIILLIIWRLATPQNVGVAARAAVL